MKKPAQGVKRTIIRFLARKLSQELRDARMRWARGIREGRAWLAIPITAASMYVLWHWAFGLGFYFGVSFLTAAVLAILRGHIFTHTFRLILVAVAVVIGSMIIPSLGGDAWKAFRRGDTIGALILAGIVVCFWLLKRYLETGQMKGVNVPIPKGRRRPRRG